MSRARVTIDRIVLNGLMREQRQAVLEGLREELARMLAHPAMSATVRPRRVPALHLASIELAPGRGGGRRLGTGVARGIGRGQTR